MNKLSTIAAISLMFLGACETLDDSSSLAQQQMGACVDTDGDGWGWNGFESCRIGETSTGGNTAGGGNNNGGSNTGGNNNGGSVPTSSGSCPQQSAGSVFRASTSPIVSNGESFYSNQGPQCVGPNNQFEGPGLRYGDFLLSNNAWNGHASTWSWEQCIELSSNGGNVVPSFDYDWGNEDDLQPGLQEWEVKSYPELIYGVKSQNEVSADCQTTGMPVRYDEMPNYTIDFSYTSNQTNNRVGDLGSQFVRGGERNIAIESFFHSSCDIRRGAGGNVEHEVMVWLDKGAERRPSGRPPIASFTDSYGHTFDVYNKLNQNDGYIAYVARNAIESGRLDWNDFIDDAKANYARYQIKEIKDDWCLGNILFGSEIWWGEGAITLNRYDITRTY